MSKSKDTRVKLHPSPSHLEPKPRRAVSEALDSCLADGLDLYAAAKVAHWNVKGSMFAPLHQLFEGIATALNAQNDTLAERAVTLGGTAHGTSAHVAKASRLPAYPQETTRGLEHVQLVADRNVLYLAGLRAARTVAEDCGDTDSVDLLTVAITEAEKHGWFLQATLSE